jgi:hypothetical protein
VKKTRHIMEPAKRTEKNLGATENRIKATEGDRTGKPDREAARGLLALLGQISTASGMVEGGGGKFEKKLILSLLFAKEVWQAVQKKRAGILREMADLIEVPEARPALVAAWRLREYWTPCLEAGFQPPHIKKSVILDSIMAAADCNHRTAEKAAKEAGLEKVFGWKAGRPRSED